MKVVQKIICFVFSVCMATTAIASGQESIAIKGRFVTSRHIQYIALCSYRTNEVIDECSFTNQSFELQVPTSIEPGVYYLYYVEGVPQKVNLIISGKENTIEVQLSHTYYKNFPVILQSKENLGWYNYLKSSSILMDQLDALFDFFSKSEGELHKGPKLRMYQSKRKQFYEEWSLFCELNKGSISGLLVKNRPYYYSDLAKEPIERDFLRRNFFWEGIDTCHPDLVQSPLYSNLIQDYLAYLGDNSKHHPFTETEQFYEYKKSITTVLHLFYSNKSTFQFAKICLKQNPYIKDSAPLLEYIDNFTTN